MKILCAEVSTVTLNDFCRIKIKDVMHRRCCRAHFFVLKVFTTISQNN